MRIALAADHAGFDLMEHLAQQLREQRHDVLRLGPAEPDPTDDYPDGWLTIDFQLMSRGPIPSDLAYLMNSGSVLPDVYRGENREMLMYEFYELFMTKTERYSNYSWDQFVHEYSVMSTVLLVYSTAFGAAISQAGLNNEEPMRVELGNRGETVADLTAEERRKRMWWRKMYANFLTTFEEFGLYEHLQTLPDNTSGMGEWYELPERFRQ